MLFNIMPSLSANITLGKVFDRFKRLGVTVSVPIMVPVNDRVSDPVRFWFQPFLLFNILSS